MENDGDPPVYINESKVKGALTWTLVNEAVEQALKSACREESSEHEDLPFSNQPPRIFTFTEGKAGVLLSMPGYVGNYSMGGKQLNTLACKLVTSFKDNATRNPSLPAILGNILLFDSNTGRLKAIIEATEITAWRTAAASIVATKHLYFARLPEKSNGGKTVAIVGCGVQGNSHSMGFCCSFESLEEIRLWNRTASKAEILAEKLEKSRNLFSNKQLRVIVTKTVEECVGKSDIIVIATFSSEPLIYASMIKSGEVHINAIGAGVNHHSEISEDLYQKSNVYIDNWASAKTELKNLKADIICEVGDIISKRKTPNNGITIFQSMGMAAEDATVAQAIYDAVKS